MLLPLLAQQADQLPQAAGGRSLVVDLLLTLAAAAVVTMSFRRMKLPTIPGYLITGAIIGPSALGLVASGENVQAISGLAIVLLMFTIGLQLDLSGIRSGMANILGIGVGSTLATWAAGIPMGMLFGLGAPAGLVLGMAMSMSSTAVAMGVLQPRREVHRVQGRICIGVSVTQDLLSVVILALMPPIAAWAGQQLGPGAVGVVSGSGLGRVGDLLLSGMVAIATIALMLLVGRRFLPMVLREAARGGGAGGGAGGAETLLVLAAATALLAATITTLVGIGPALGAFLAGFMLAATPFRHQIAGQLAPLRELFMAIFFTVVGLNMNIPAVLSGWWIVLLGLLSLFAVKGTIIAVSTWAGGATAATSLLAAALLTQAGEFAMVVLAAAAMTGVLPPEQQPIIIAVVVLSLIVTPTAYELALRLTPGLSRVPPARWVRSMALREALGGAGSGAEDGAALAAEGGGATGALVRGHVIVAGFGLVGRAIADRFNVAGIPYTIVELNTGTIRKQSNLGRSIVYGDISNPEVLESAGIRTAEAVVLTIPDDEAALRACKAIRALAPRAFIAVRSSYLSNAFMATTMGADHVVVAEVATAEAMAKQVMDKLERRAAAGMGGEGK